MWLLSSLGCDDAHPCPVTAAVVLALTPLAAVFVAINILAVRHLYPKLSAAAGDKFGSAGELDDDDDDSDADLLPLHSAPASTLQLGRDNGRTTGSRRRRRWRRRRAPAAAWAFGSTVALTVTLALLILAEISERMDPAARNLALGGTVPALLFLLIVLVPWIECRSLVRAPARRRIMAAAASSRTTRMRLWLQLFLFTGWMLAFWSVGRAVPPAETGLEARTSGLVESLIRACLERVGVVGISLMALLAGFASVSSPWQTFSETRARRRRPVTEAHLQRKQAGLEAAREMLSSKRRRLQALENAAPAGPAASGPVGSSFVGKMMGSIRATASGRDSEMRALRVDIAGLETMELGLASKLALLRMRRAAALRASSPLGRLLEAASSAFSAYCLYRVAATTATTARRLSSPSASFASSDPINRFLGLLARHWDPKLDQLAWARTISFALSGLMLLASANSAIQTLHLFAKWTPGLVRPARANLALVVGQVAATYVISASLLLRSQLPADAGGEAVGGVLRGALSPAFVDAWFEGCFLLGSLLTGLGIWLGRRLSLDDDDDDYDYDYAADEGRRRETDPPGAKRL